MESQEAIRPKRQFWGVIRWIVLLGTIFGLSSMALVAVTNKAVIWSSSNAFCVTFCVGVLFFRQVVDLI